MSNYQRLGISRYIHLPRIEAFSTLQARMDPAVGSKRKLNPSSPGATVMLSIFVDVGHGSTVMLCCCDCYGFRQCHLVFVKDDVLFCAVMMLL